MDAKPQDVSESSAAEQADAFIRRILKLPDVLTAIQSQQNAEMLAKLPSSVRRRLKAITKLQLDVTHIDAKCFEEIQATQCNKRNKCFEEIQAIQCKRNKLLSAIDEKLSKIIDGEYKPNDEESQLSLDEEEELCKQLKYKATLEEQKKKEDSPAKGIPGCLQTIFNNADLLYERVQVHEPSILKYIKDIKDKVIEEPMPLKFPHWKLDHPVFNKRRNEETRLLRSLRRNRSDAYIIRLLNANADLIQWCITCVSPLAVALGRSTLIVAQEMANRGANLNDALQEVAKSPKNYNPAALYFLLYHGADVDETILMSLLSRGNESAAELFLNYYDGSLSGLSKILYCAVDHDFPNIAIKLIEMGANVNYVPFERLNMLELCLRKGHVALFKCMWKYFDYNIIGKSFFRKLFRWSELISTDEWMDCLMLILTSSVAPELAKFKFFSYFFIWCKKQNDRPDLSDRLRIIYLALSLSFKVFFDGFILAYDIFGFNEEFEILIYFIKNKNVRKWYYSNETYYFLMLFYLGIADDFNDLYRFWPKQRDMVSHHHFKCLRYFSRSCYNRLFKSEDFREKRESLPQLPSLFQLSRTGARQFIRQAYNVKQPYQFHDAVRQLNLPEYFEDVIRFKTPGYL